jgi:hypothetical protein
MEPFREIAAFEARAQFVVPRSVASTIDVDALRRRAIEMGIERPSIEIDSRHARGGVRLTCRTGIALILIADWKRVGERAPHTERGEELRKGIALASEAASTACLSAWNPRRLSMGEVGYVGPG